jgi:hypothetical protein
MRISLLTGKMKSGQMLALLLLLTMVPASAQEPVPGDVEELFEHGLKRSIEFNEGAGIKTQSRTVATRGYMVDVTTAVSSPGPLPSDSALVGNDQPKPPVQAKANTSSASADKPGAKVTNPKKTTVEPGSSQGKPQVAGAEPSNINATPPKKINPDPTDVAPTTIPVVLTEKPVEQSVSTRIHTGLQFYVYLLDPTGGLTQVNTTRVFKSGDEIIFAFRANVNGYLVIEQKQDEGDWEKLYPSNMDNNWITAGVHTLIPSNEMKEWFRFDDNPGEIHLRISLARSNSGTQQQQQIMNPSNMVASRSLQRVSAKDTIVVSSRPDDDIVIEIVLKHVQ